MLILRQCVARVMRARFICYAYVLWEAPGRNRIKTELERSVKCGADVFYKLLARRRSNFC